jgi:bifunctional non-homologous end joining protein LigD
MALDEYRRKRDFRKTPEPRGKRKPRKSHRLTFVVQKHGASHLHYDLRLEMNGVLKSWAVPKGADIDPAKKRLAMQVEDHPLEYRGFEGIIPQGQYGEGTVMLWDRGFWEPIRSPAQGFREGYLKFNLHGQKLQGGWMLVRKGGRSSESDERHWFLVKERDEFARPDLSITEEMPLSVVTGRNLQEIAAESDPAGRESRQVLRHRRRRTRKCPPMAVSRPNRARRETASLNARTNRSGSVKPATPTRSRGTRTNYRSALQKLLNRPGVRRARLPKSHQVELATLVDSAPAGDNWVHEIKFDGYRML